MIAAALFLRPEAWPLLLLGPLAWLLLRVLDRARARRLADAVGLRVAVLAGAPDGARRGLRRALFAAGLVLALSATLRPAFGGPRREAAWRGVDLVVCLDVSRSMWARDLPPDRLTRAHGEIRALAARARGDRLGLVAFAGEARVVVPLTEDAASFAVLAALADPSTVRRGGTDLGAALEAALAALAGRGDDPAAVVLLTDGEDLGGRGLGVAARLRDRGIPVHAVGFGTALGSKIAIEGGGAAAFVKDRAGGDVVTAMDAAGLGRIAEATDGVFAEAGPEPGALVRLYEDRILPTARAAYGTRQGRGADGFQWPLFAAVLLWLLDLGLADRRRR